MIVPIASEVAIAPAGDAELATCRPWVALPIVMTINTTAVISNGSHQGPRGPLPDAFASISTVAPYVETNKPHARPTRGSA